MPYPPPTLLEKILLPFRILYWRFIWKPPPDLVDYPCEHCERYALGNFCDLCSGPDWPAYRPRS